MRTACVILLGLAATAAADEPKPRRVLPGLRADGFVQLPNQWALKPAGRQIPVGDLPVNVQLHPTGQFAAVLHCGFKTHEVVILNLGKGQTPISSRVPIPQGFYGLAFSPDGRQVYASGGEFDVLHVWDFDKGLLHNARTLDVSAGRRTVPAGLAVSGRDLFACGLWADALVRVPLDNPANKVVIPLTPPQPKPAEAKTGELPSPDDNRSKEVVANDDDRGVEPAKNNGWPYAVLAEPGGKRAFVSLWAKSAVAVVDLQANAVVATWPTAAHPTELALSPDGKALYVACANSTKVSVLDPADGKELQTVVCSLYPQAPAGNTPNSLTLTPDGKLLFVANADANNLAGFNVANPKEAKPLGFIPTGWYPTSVRYNPLDKTLYVSNGKGLQSDANRAGPNPEKPARDLRGYIAGLFEGTVSVIPLPTPQAMTALSKTAFQCSPLLKGDAVQGAAGVPADNPIPRKLGDPSPIKHVIYIVKENRTYDQVFGDLPQGNGEPELCLFPRTVTPNHHKLAEEFVLLDNTYVDGEVSADGHEWSMGAYATDFVEKLWPLSYRGSPKKTFGYPAEGAFDKEARPAGGYLWDRATEAGVSFRNYGEWVTNGKPLPGGGFEDGKASVPAVVGHFDPKYRGYDLTYPDVKRAERFVSELKRFEAEGEMPRLQILRIGNDHTAGTRVGQPTPRAMVADNDLALGRMVDAVSKSKFWKDTAIFVIEDDAQNGPDHVDAHRVVALVVSPYTKRKFVDSDLYSTTSLLRTMELILGLKPMSQFDAAARPMFNSFTGKPDFTPYTHVPAEIDLNEKNAAGAWGAERSAAFNLEVEDRADDLLFNEVIWKSVKGPHSRMPAPVRAAFFLPRD
jgi:DNA-binding beta-propeller fold protein YncE